MKSDTNIYLYKQILSLNTEDRKVFKSDLFFSVSKVLRDYTSTRGNEANVVTDAAKVKDCISVAVQLYDESVAEVDMFKILASLCIMDFCGEKIPLQRDSLPEKYKAELIKLFFSLEIHTTV